MKNTPAVWKRNTFKPLLELRRDIDRLFGDYLVPFPEAYREGEEEWFNPACDIEETETGYFLTLDVPGVKKDDIKIEVHDNQLAITGTRHFESKKEEKTRRMSERSYGQFERMFTLPTVVDAGKIEANYDNGVLYLTIPKAESAKAHLVKIGEGKGKAALEKKAG